MNHRAVAPATVSGGGPVVRVVRGSVEHARIVWCAWALAAVGLLAAAVSMGSAYRTDFRLPGTDSQRATNLIDQHFPARRGEVDLLVVHARRGSVDDPGVRAEVEQVVAAASRVRGVTRVVDPFIPRPGSAISTDRRTAIVLIHFREPTDAVPASSVRELIRIANAARGRALDVGVSGQAVENVESNQPGAGEAIALATAVLVLLIGFGSAAAVGIALLSTMVGLSVGFAAMSLASHLVAIPTFATQVATTIGLGVGIDYALLILARYRSAARSGHDLRAATVTAMRTAGRAVAFAGGTVVLAMLGLYLVGLPFIQGMGLGVILVVVPTVLAALTALPALLSRSGDHLDRWRPPGLGARELTGYSIGWAQWAARVQRRPVTAICAALAILGVLAVPAFSLRLANANASTDNDNTATHRAYQLTAAAFGQGFTRPFEIVAGVPPARPDAIRALRSELRHTPDVASVGAADLDPGHRYALIDVYPASPPSSAETSALLKRLRGPVRAHLRQRRVDIHVGGSAAIGADLSTTITTAAPTLLAAVIGTSLLLLLLLFRSVVVALKAGLMNLLAITAAFGVVVAAFQWGWATHLLGVDHAGPIEVFLPVLLFPTVFGLSMDYEVFLLARIRDEWDNTQNNTRAVTEGLATTGRVVTAGAAIMVVLFASLVFADARTVKIFGLGLAAAIVLDAVIVRSILLPATMQLLGPYNWWLPTWLNQRLPRFELDSPSTETAPSAPQPHECRRVALHR